MREALIVLAVRAGQQEPALVKALADGEAVRRAAAVEALIRAGTPEQRAPLRRS